MRIKFLIEKGAFLDIDEISEGDIAAFIKTRIYSEDAKIEIASSLVEHSLGLSMEEATEIAAEYLQAN